ncbi:dihydrodipicolinate reductase [Ruegeria sp. 2012CJ15-1]
MLFCAIAVPAYADFAQVRNEAQFKAIVSGKILTRPLIKLQVSPDGKISGTGLRWAVEGNWNWQNGYFCRDLYWGGSDLGYNCQEVRVRNGKIRFTSDRGKGDFADFRLRSD